ncbi:hypothetical protein DFP72DRAFT_906659 [Ephemerocybe angulata]|uniref:Uncharacterized protein n=1 Tax=Ephemerocybe angulata TaxID=980116 RepID=A0A8H6HSH4_9AGAR|nr:hypothetical protein DFP72DRAFT_906659 [Tulosesus angulatus]
MSEETTSGSSPLRSARRSVTFIQTLLRAPRPSASMSFKLSLHVLDTFLARKRGFLLRSLLGCASVVALSCGYRLGGSGSPLGSTLSFLRICVGSCPSGRDTIQWVLARSGDSPAADMLKLECSQVCSVHSVVRGDYGAWSSSSSVPSLSI